jgi:hypothetical protein
MPAYVFSGMYYGFAVVGFPIRKSPDITPVCGSPELIAACHVLHRLILPRHPPCALSSLTIELTLAQQSDLHLRYRGRELIRISLFCIAACMCLLLNLRGVNNTLNYPKDTQLNTPSPRPQTCDTALRVVLHGDRPAQPCNFFYPIDFVVKHPVAPEINPVPTLGWVRTALLFSAAQRSTS